MAGGRLGTSFTPNTVQCSHQQCVGQKTTMSALFDPLTIPGLLEPKCPAVTKRKRDATRIEVSEGGSCVLRDLKAKGDAKKAAKAAEEALVKERREEREEKKRARQFAEEYLVLCWQDCKDGCTCEDPDECPVKGMKRCDHCGAIKKRKCGRPECKAALAPLLLTHQAPLLLQE